VRNLKANDRAILDAGRVLDGLARMASEFGPEAIPGDGAGTDREAMIGEILDALELILIVSDRRGWGIGEKIARRIIARKP
jgi:hypothetical protein